MKTQRRVRETISNKHLNSIEDQLLFFMKLYSSDMQFLVPWVQNENIRTENRKIIEEKKQDL